MLALCLWRGRIVPASIHQGSVIRTHVDQVAPSSTDQKDHFSLNVLLLPDGCDDTEQTLQDAKEQLGESVVLCTDLDNLENIYTDLYLQAARHAQNNTLPNNIKEALPEDEAVVFIDHDTMMDELTSRGPR